MSLYSRNSCSYPVAPHDNELIECRLPVLVRHGICQAALCEVLPSPFVSAYCCLVGCDVISNNQLRFLMVSRKGLSVFIDCNIYNHKYYMGDIKQM